MSIQTIGERNEQLVAGLRAAADFFEAHPDMPLPLGVRMYAVITRPESNQAQRYAAVHDAAQAMQAPVVVAKNGGREAERAFGPVELTVFTGPDEHQEPGTVIARAQDSEAVPA